MRHVVKWESDVRSEICANFDVRPLINYRRKIARRLIKGVISAILLDDDRARIVSLVRGNYGIPIPIRHIRRPNLIAIHTVAHSIATDAIPAHDHLDTLDDTSVLSSRFSPLMIKRPCVTTVLARTIGSTREHCVHNVETDFALYSDTYRRRYAAFFAFDQAIRVPLNLMTGRCREDSPDFSSSRELPCFFVASRPSIAEQE